jgi:hypothetical protein
MRKIKYNLLFLNFFILIIGLFILEAFVSIQLVEFPPLFDLPAVDDVYHVGVHDALHAMGDRYCGESF